MRGMHPSKHIIHKLTCQKRYDAKQSITKGSLGAVTVGMSEKQDLRKTARCTCEMAVCVTSSNIPRRDISLSGEYNIAGICGNKLVSSGLAPTPKNKPTNG